ncbi:glycine--tRNA ligase subunit beta, partial [Thermodesulfobacteriota bacterium]
LNNLQSIFRKKLKGLALEHGEIRGAATPRRLAVGISGLSDRQPDRREEILGPPRKAAFTQDNQPTKAAEGFARSQNIRIEDLKTVSTPKGEYIMAVKESPGQATDTLLASLLPEIIQELHFPKSMRWGAGETSFARPIQWILAMYNDKPVVMQTGIIPNGHITRGHRFMAPEAIPVKDFNAYLESLRKAHVLADPQERKQKVIKEINHAADEAGGHVLPDDDLVDLVTNLVESPHAICGTFHEKFLQLPKDVLITSMREHQKYFAVVDGENNLLPHFIAVNNTQVKDAAITAEGHQRVLRARLEDAMFFFKDDQQKKLTDRVTDLSGIIFQSKLGTLREKTERLTTLASGLAEDTSPAHKESVGRAALLAKTDLLTAMVNEFPSLQGVMGRDYARLEGEDPDVAKAIEEHYLPVRAGGELPSGMIGALVGLADRIDTVVGCFGIGQVPTGTADPFGLRRQTLGFLHILEKHGLSLSLDRLVDQSMQLYGDKLTVPGGEAKKNILLFIKNRFVNDLTSRGIPLEALEATTSVSFDNPLDCRKKTDALVEISGQESFALLAGAFKRVVNIIKNHQTRTVNKDLLKESAELDLYSKYLECKASTESHLNQRDYGKVMAEILKMKDPVDRFFDDVMVMVEDEAIRNNRLSLLGIIADLFLNIGDFSRMNPLTQENQSP